MGACKFTLLQILFFLMPSITGWKYSSVLSQDIDLTFTLNNLVQVGGGQFQMGRTSDIDLGHPVELSSYKIGKFKITNVEFMAFLNDISKAVEISVSTWTENVKINSSSDDTRRVTRKRCTVSYGGETILYIVDPSVPAELDKLDRDSKYYYEHDNVSRIQYNFGVQKGGKFFVAPEFEFAPITGVTWVGAKAYCEWLSKNTGKKIRLPTEAEWEYAFLGGQQMSYTEQKNNHTEQTRPNYPIMVGQSDPNILGLYGMYNLPYELCSDWYKKRYYNQTLIKDPVGPPEGVFKVLRGKQGRIFIEPTTSTIKGIEEKEEEEGNDDNKDSEYFPFKKTHKRKKYNRDVPCVNYGCPVSFRIVEEI